jgi:hypothetical protein
MTAAQQVFVAPVVLSQWDTAVTKGGSTSVNYVDVYSGTAQIGRIYPKAGTGSVTQDFVTGTRWQLTASFAPNLSALLVPGVELRPFTGFRYATTVEVVPLGCFPLTASSFTLSAGTSIDVSCHDRYQWIVGSTFLTPYASDPTLPIRTQLASLVLGTGMWTADQISNTISSTAKPGVLSWDQDRSQAIGDYCTSVGAEAYVDRYGTFILRDRQALGTSRMTLATGNGGRLIDATFTTDTSAVYNVVTVVPTQTDPAFVIPAVTVRITDTKNPAYPRPGRVMTRAYRLDSSLFTSTAQATAAAQKILSKISAKAEQGSIVCMPDAKLDAGDTITVALPDGTLKKVQIQQVSYPMNVTDEQNITTVSTRSDEDFKP